MPWCPKCRNEYRDGIEVCSECGVELVDELGESPLVSVIFGDQEQMTKLKNFMEYNGLRDVQIAYIESDDVYEISVRQEDLHHAETISRVFLKQLEKSETAKEMDEAEKVAVASRLPKKSEKPYQSNAARAEENRSSGQILLAVGGLGLVFVILGIAGVIPFQFANPLMVYGVMGAVFFFFLIFGFVSYKNAASFASLATNDNALRNAVLDWAKENLRAEEIDAGLADEDLPEEILYFKRVERLKKKMNLQFMNLDQDFLDYLIDEVVFDMVFSPEKSEQ